jgi:hypothetical protein
MEWEASQMYLVTFEDAEGMWFRESAGFDRWDEANKYADGNSGDLKIGQTIEIYECLWRGRREIPGPNRVWQRR